MKILVTGFDPFGKEILNPSLEAVKKLPENILGAKIIKLEVPTVFQKSTEVLKQAVIVDKPDVVVNVGQAGGRSCVTLERIAINLEDATIPDNEGNQPVEKPIRKEGPAAYFSTLSLKEMVEQMKLAGYPVSISNTAGTFVCNHLMYQLLDLSAKSYPKMLAGFIHVPYIPQQVVNKPQLPSMDLETIAKSLEKALEAVVLFVQQKEIASSKKEI